MDWYYQITRPHQVNGQVLTDAGEDMTQMVIKISGCPEEMDFEQVADIIETWLSEIIREAHKIDWGYLESEDVYNAWTSSRLHKKEYCTINLEL